MKRGRAPSGQALAVPVEPVARLDPSGFDPSRKSVVETMREKLDPHMFAVLRRSFEDADYNREYEAKGLSAWESPEYRPYCLRCETMRRMEHRDYGYQCSVCGTQCSHDGGGL